MKRKRKNDEQTFISWQISAWQRLINTAIEQHKQNWHEAKWDEKASLVGFIIPSLLVAVWAFCGIIPSALLGIGWIYSCLACISVYCAVLLWTARWWLNSRYSEYIDDIEEAEEAKNDG